MQFTIYKSTRKSKKFMILLPTNKWVHFMSADGSSYLDHNDDKKKKNWIARHSTNKNWNDINSPVWWAREIGWNKKTIDASIRDTEKRFGIKIINYV